MTQLMQLHAVRAASFIRTPAKPQFPIASQLDCLSMQLLFIES